MPERNNKASASDRAARTSLELPRMLDSRRGLRAIATNGALRRRDLLANVSQKKGAALIDCRSAPLQNKPAKWIVWVDQLREAAAAARS